MTEPCPMHIVTSDGEKRYCEQGPKGHWGTCVGWRPEWEYRALVEQARKAKA